MDGDINRTFTGPQRGLTAFLPRHSATFTFTFKVTFIQLHLYIYIYTFTFVLTSIYLDFHGHKGQTGNPPPQSAALYNTANFLHFNVSPNVLSFTLYRIV